MEMTKKIVDAVLFDMVVYNYINTHERVYFNLNTLMLMLANQCWILTLICFFQKAPATEQHETSESTTKVSWGLNPAPLAIEATVLAKLLVYGYFALLLNWNILKYMK